MPRPVKNLSGHIFGKLIVLYLHEVRKGNAYWMCRCDCGNTKPIGRGALFAGADSCGCEGRKRIGNRQRTHGMTESAEYEIWATMIQRCTNPNAINYADYGGRGISVCESWMNSFVEFYAAVGPRPSKQHSIDRYPDPNGNYEPGNVRWATRVEQQRNRRVNRMATIDGETHCVTEWAELKGVPIRRVQSRLKRGWSIEKALSKPARNYSCHQ